jgi:hypothetical protein
MKHLSEEDLVLLYYGEPGADAEHLAYCAECRAAGEALAGVLDSCNVWEPPEPRPGLARRVWPERRTATAWRWLAVAAALALAFFVGRYSSQPRPPQGFSAEARRRILNGSVADHLDRAEILLTEIAHAGDRDPVDRERAQDLIEEGRLMRQALEAQGETAPLPLLDDLERFLLEAENAPDRNAAALRDRMESDSLLFKLRIIETNLREKGQRI